MSPMCIGDMFHSKIKNLIFSAGSKITDLAVIENRANLE